ncbi:ABC transporter ATP-binding protein [Chloroflexota bacterium]
MTLIETVNLCQHHGAQEILKSINISVDRGEVLALIGPTGAGKTTLLRLLDLIDLPTSGKIYFDGTDITTSTENRLELRRRIAFVLQKPVVFNMSVYDNVACGLKWRGISRSTIREKVNNILEIVGLSVFSDRNARTLSGGEMQRVAIARAVAVKPEVLLLDEPTANLDPISAAKIEALIAEIIKRYVTTVIMATHDMAQGQRLADKIAVLINGRVLQTGDSRDIFAYPKNRDVAEFVGVENIIDGIISSNKDKVVTINADGAVIEAIADYAVGEKVSACIRPEDVTISLAKVSSSARNSFVGDITHIIAMGPLTRVEIDCGFSLAVLITKRSTEELDLGMGKKVYAAFKATGVHVIKRN